MSHDDLASLWSLLDIHQDVTVYIREATGQHALSSIVAQHDSGTNPHHLLAYAIELTTIFNFLHTSTRTNTNGGDPKDIEINFNASRHIHLSLAYFIRNVCVDDVIVDSQISRLTLQLCLHTILSALCALHTSQVVNQNKEAEHIAAAAQKLAIQIPEQRMDLRPLKELFSFVSSSFCSNSISQSESVTVTWKELCHASTHVEDPQHPRLSLPNAPDRSDIIEDLVNRATKLNTNSIDRISAMLAIYHIFWRSDAYMTRSCGAQNCNQPIAPSIDGLEAIATAQEIRSLLQEHLLNANADNSNDFWAKSFGLYLLFMPGAEPSCALNKCQCVFNEKESSIILAMRRQKKLLQNSLQKFYTQSPLNDCPIDYVSIVLTAFKNRLLSIHGMQESQHNNLQSINQVESLLRPKEQNLATPSTIARYGSQRPSPMVRNITQSSIDEINETGFARTRSLSPRLLPQSRYGSCTSEQTSQAGSTTTTFTSSSRDGSDTTNGRIQFQPFPQSPLGSDKIVVETPRSLSIGSPKSPEKTFPEVAIRSPDSDGVSIMSEYSIPMTILPLKNTTSRGRFGNFLKSKKDVSSTFTVPRFRFFASGKHILLWTRQGGCVINLDHPVENSYLPIREADILHAAGGTYRFVVISRLSESYRMSVYNLDNIERPVFFDVAKGPGAIDLSPDDRYLALKYTRSLLLYDLQQPGTIITHKLPSHDSSRPGFGNHLVAFAPDSQSFMASTRFQPEKVYTYWAQCAQSTTARGIVTCSTAPFGHVDDHGLTSLTVLSPTARSSACGFLGTFTEKGQPSLLHMHGDTPSSRTLRDHKERIGTRVHCAAMHVDPGTSKANLVLVNQSNAVFWVSDLFGRDSDAPQQIAVLKRPKSLRNEVQIAMSGVNEATCFWVDRVMQKGVLVRVGKGGGKANPVYYRLDVEPLCA